MEPMLQWGLDIIRLVQTCASPELTFIMRIITNLGAAPLYVILLPLVYWCVDEKKGIRLATVVLISVCINITLKFLLNQPRPFFDSYDPSVGMIDERLGGLPSGHAQNSLVILVVIASWLKKKWAFGIAALVCLLISFSRIYLGVHFPTDIFGGWILGGLVLCGYFLLGSRIEAFLARETALQKAESGIRSGMIASAALAFLMILYRPGEEFLMPGGTMLGIGVGYCLNLRHVGFSSRVFDKTRMAKYLTLSVRFLVGIAGLMLVFTVSGKLIPYDSGNYNLFGFARFTLAGLWISAGAPWVFVRMHLAGIKQKEQ